MNVAVSSDSTTRWVALALALAVLDLSLTFVSVWPTLGVRPSTHLSAEALLLVLGLAIAHGWRRPPAAAACRTLAIVWAVLVVGRYAWVTTRSLYGRSLNLYWDLGLLPDVGAMFAYVAQPRMLAAVVSLVVLVPLLLYLPLRWAIGCVNDACARPRARRALAAAAALLLGVGIAGRVDGRFVPRLQFAPPVTVAVVEEFAELAREITGLGRRPLPPAPHIETDLAHVKGADVLVLFVESYGATSWSDPGFRDALAPARARLADSITETARTVVTALVESTTFGGESWLAHISLLSGTEVRDADINRRLMAERRDTMVTAFARGGYRTVAVMPGLHAAWPEGAFYGFDRIYGAPDLEYQGPPFGWWDVTDQFALARMDAIAIAPRPRQPAFVFLPTISTHVPFTPVPPYQPDWVRVLTATPYDEDDLRRAYDQTPDWTSLGGGYAESLAYAYDTLGGYLRLRGDRDLVMVIIGDHQPPSLVSGEGASWDVPIHVVASRPEVLGRLQRRGFRDGLAPQGPALARMDTLMPILLDAFGNTR